MVYDSFISPDRMYNILSRFTEDGDSGLFPKCSQLSNKLHDFTSLKTVIFIFHMSSCNLSATNYS